MRKFRSAGTDRLEAAHEKKHSRPGPDAERDLQRELSFSGLRYRTDQSPGICRLGPQGNFTYQGPTGKPIENQRTLARIRRLVLPPAWTDVWISPDARSHLQATGKDARGRKQYRYHEAWRSLRDDRKYDRLLEFGAALPKIRRVTEEDLKRQGLPREKVLGAVVKLLESTSIRIGNESYRRQNRSFGLTTLRDRHATIQGATMQFTFRGKSGKRHEIELRDRRLAEIVRRCRDVPGDVLFQYRDADGQRQAISSDEVNAYIRAASGGEFSAKDFRTWNGTVLALRFLRACEPSRSERHGKKQVVEVIRAVASQLGNTPAVCRKAYVHPGILRAYLESMLEIAEETRGSEETFTGTGLSEDEHHLMGLLRNNKTGADRAA